MATITLFEQARSRDAVVDLRSGSTTLNYLALVQPPYTISDDQDLLDYLSANLPTRYGFQLLRNFDQKAQGGPVWAVTATYGFDEGDSIPTPGGDPLPYEFAFDTTGGTQHITQSLATISSVKYGSPSTPRTVNDMFTRAPRTVNDAVTTAGTAQLISATAAFTSGDIGAVLSSTTSGMLPPGVTITGVVNGTTVLLSASALATQLGANLTISGTMIQSATANFTSADVGASVTSTSGALPAGASITTVISTTQALISSPVLLTTGGVNLAIGALAPTQYNRAIGVSRDGVAGTDVIAPKLEFQLTRNFSGMTMEYIQRCHSLTGSQNDAPFFGFSAGELLFLGASGAPSQNNQANADPLCRVTFRFAASPNLINVDVVPPDSGGNPLLRVAQKNGWDYLWVRYVDAVDPVSKQMFPRPDAAYVEQVYRQADFSQLLIGT